MSPRILWCLWLFEVPRYTYAVPTINLSQALPHDSFLLFCTINLSLFLYTVLTMYGWRNYRIATYGLYIDILCIVSIVYFVLYYLRNQTYILFFAFFMCACGRPVPFCMRQAFAFNSLHSRHQCFTLNYFQPTPPSSFLCKKAIEITIFPNSYRSAKTVSSAQAVLSTITTAREEEHCVRAVRIYGRPPSSSRRR